MQTGEMYAWFLEIIVIRDFDRKEILASAVDHLKQEFCSVRVPLLFGFQAIFLLDRQTDMLRQGWCKVGQVMGMEVVFQE